MDQHTPSTEPAAAPAPHLALDPSRLALLPRLIDDVLLAILDELAQPEYTDEGYELRQHTLRSVCLASRRLCALARPVLWRQVVVTSDEQFEQLRAASDLGMCTKHLALVTMGSIPMCLSCLHGYANLRRLELVDADSASLRLDHPPTFPQLEVLIFWECRAPPYDTTEWLASAWLPRLKVLVSRRSWSKIQPALSPCLAKQLEIVQVNDGPSGDARDKQWLSSSSPTIVVFNPAPLGPGVTLPRNAMYSFTQGLDRSSLLRRQMIGCLKGHVGREPRADPDAATVLMLPRQLLRAADDGKPPGALDIVDAWRELEELCRLRGRRVIWYDEEELKATREFVPLEFKRCARELKAWSLAESASSSSSR